MYMQFPRLLVLSALLAGGIPTAAAAQDAAAVPAAVQGTPTLPPYPSVCGNPLGSPAAEPPEGSAPVVVTLEVCFGREGGTPVLPIDTYVFYIQVRPFVSAPSRGSWIPYTEAVQETMREDFKRLWEQGFLDDLLIEVNDYVFPNGVTGKVLSYVMEERERIKTVRYEGSDEIDRTKIEEQLRDRNLAIAVDSFVDPAKIRRIETVVREMMLEKGFNAEVSHAIEPIPGGGKTVNLTFNVTEGPKVKIKRVTFEGNDAFSDAQLKKQIKDNKPAGFLSFITGTGTVNATKFEEDAERVAEYYQNRGYPNVRVGQPEIVPIEESKNGKTQWVELRVPVTEGRLYRFGELAFDGNTRVRTEFLQTLYEVREGEIYNRKKITEGHRRAQEVYGSLGFMEFTPFEDRSLSDQRVNPDDAFRALVPSALAPPPGSEPATPTPAADTTTADASPTVDVTIRITEGEQFFINRIVFTGNTTTRDNVIRRELGTLLEGAPFNTEALKSSVRRINQLGYFQPLEGSEKDMQVEKTPGATNLVDVTMKLQEQNRNQLTFGAGISQYEGFFGQLAFQTSNFMGRGETLSVSVQGGERAKNYQLGFTEPFLFDRNITAGFDIYTRELEYIGYYTQESRGGSLVFGVPLRPFTRFFFNYAYQEVGISDLNEALIDSSCLFTAQGCSVIESLDDLSQLTDTQVDQLCRNPFVCDSLLLGAGGKRTISKVTPTLLHNTVDHPIFPTTGRKFTLAADVALLGGNTNYIKPHVEGIWFFRHTNRTSIGLRGLFEYIRPMRDTTEANMPIFERLFLGGEYNVRGFDIRSIGPTVEGSQVVLGGNKSLVFNAEYLISIAGPVRLVLFYDAGQVRDFGEKFAWKEDLEEVVFPPPPPLQGGLGEILEDPNAPGTTTRVVGKTSAFKTSTGIELRFFMPVLNVPFRLIYAWNPQREGVLDNDLRPAKNTTFRFAVGTTF